MATGEAAGAAAGLSLDLNVAPRNLPIDALQRHLASTDVIFDPSTLKEYLPDPAAIKRAHKLLNKPTVARKKR